MRSCQNSSLEEEYIFADTCICKYVKCSRVSYVNVKFQIATLDCVDTDLVYTCAQTRVCHFISYSILLNPTDLTMPVQMKR